MNPYEVLEISPGASPEEIKAAYHRMAKLWHPDRFTGAAKADAERRFRTLAEAFNLLKDAPRREEPPQRSAPPEPPGPGPGQTQPYPQVQVHNQQIQLNEAGEGKEPQAKTPDDWYRDAAAAYAEKAYGRALALILYALRMEGERAEFHAFHGKVLEATGGNARTKVQALETAIKLNAKDVDSMILLAQTFQNLGMQARATRIWETVHNLAPNHVIFNPPPGKGSGQAKERLQGLGEQFSSLVADAKLTLDKIFRRG